MSNLKSLLTFHLFGSLLLVSIVLGSILAKMLGRDDLGWIIGICLFQTFFAGYCIYKDLKKK